METIKDYLVGLSVVFILALVIYGIFTLVSIIGTKAALACVVGIPFIFAIKSIGMTFRRMYE